MIWPGLSSPLKPDLARAALSAVSAPDWMVEGKVRHPHRAPSSRQTADASGLRHGDVM